MLGAEMGAGKREEAGRASTMLRSPDATRRGLRALGDTDVAGSPPPPQTRAVMLPKASGDRKVLVYDKLFPHPQKKKEKISFFMVEVVRRSGFPGGPLAEATLPMKGRGSGASQIGGSALYLGGPVGNKPRVSLSSVLKACG